MLAHACVDFARSFFFLLFGHQQNKVDARWSEFVSVLRLRLVYNRKSSPNGNICLGNRCPACRLFGEILKLISVKRQQSDVCLSQSPGRTGFSFFYSNGIELRSNKN